MPGLENRNLRVLLLLAAVFVAYMMKSILVVTPNIPANSPFNTERAFERLSNILGDETPHPVDSDTNDIVRERLLTQIREMGFAPQVDDEFICAELRSRNVGCARVKNVSFWIGDKGSNAVLIMSHYDSVPAGPGAADDGIGVAASLEIASVLKNRELDRPVLVLITDGEEAGLFGAKAFVGRDPRAQMIGAVVNMEARGNRGLATLIQTSRPNGRDLNVMDITGRLPAASSLNADVYDLLPNDTDMTEFLGLPIDAVNYAISHGAQFYHTPGDNLENLDRRSLAHIGMSGLSATESFLSRDTSKSEGQYVYTDVLGRWLLSFPLMIAVLLLGSGVLTSGALLIFRREEGGLLRALLAPILAIAIGVGIAMATTWLVAWIRPERSFGSAHPWALRSVHVSGALLGCVLAYFYICRPHSRQLAFASAWFWFGLIGSGLYFIVPGALILFAPPLLFFAVSAGLYLLDHEDLAKINAIIGAAVFGAIALPLGALGENGLFIEGSGPFVVLAIFLFTMFAPFAVDGDETKKSILWILPVCGFVICAALSALVPAYSKAAPRGLSIAHTLKLSDDEAKWVALYGEGFPKQMLEAARLASPSETHASLEQDGRHIAAPPFEQGGIGIEIIDDVAKGDTRALRMRITAPNADFVRMSFDHMGGVKAIRYNGETVSSDTHNLRTLRCSGRSCRTGQLTLHVASEAELSKIAVTAVYYGLGPQSERLVAARPDWAIPQGFGDHRSVSGSFSLEDGTLIKEVP